MAANKFDPFIDRLSRDIRNSLSEAFIGALAEMAPSACREAVDIWRAKNPSGVYLEYIQDRWRRYDRVFKQVTIDRLDNPLLRSLVIWNNGLFFEFHDHLEGLWKQSSGDERQGFKGLIKAAGVYIHLENGNQQAAKRLSVKSHLLIRQHSRSLIFITNLENLALKLERLDPVAPRLENPALHQGHWSAAD